MRKRKAAQPQGEKDSLDTTIDDLWVQVNILHMRINELYEHLSKLHHND